MHICRHNSKSIYPSDLVIDSVATQMQKFTSLAYFSIACFRNHIYNQGRAVFACSILCEVLQNSRNNVIVIITFTLFSSSLCVIQNFIQTLSFNVKLCGVLDRGVEFSLVLFAF